MGVDRGQVQGRRFRVYDFGLLVSMRNDFLILFKFMHSIFHFVKPQQNPPTVRIKSQGETALDSG